VIPTSGRDEGTRANRRTGGRGIGLCTAYQRRSIAERQWVGGVWGSGCGNRLAPPTGWESILKGNGSGGLVTPANAGSDLRPATSGASILKRKDRVAHNGHRQAPDYAAATAGRDIERQRTPVVFTSAVAALDYAPVSTAPLLEGVQTGQRRISTQVAADIAERVTGCSGTQYLGADALATHRTAGFTNPMTAVDQLHWQREGGKIGTGTATAQSFIGCSGVFAD